MSSKKNTMYKLIVQDEKIFAKDIEKIGKLERDAIFSKITLLKTTGIEHAQVKKLKNYKVADFRLRVGDYRILFNIDLIKKEIVLLRVLHRSKLY